MIVDPRPDEFGKTPPAVPRKQRHSGNPAEESPRETMESLQRTHRDHERRAEERIDELVATNMQLRQEIDQLRREQETLHETVDRYNAAFEGAPLGIVSATTKGIIVRVNRAFCSLLGYTAEELCGRYVGDLTFADDFSHEELLIHQVLEGVLPGFAIQKRYHHKDGHLVWAQLTISVPRRADGNIVTVIGMVEDMTSQKQAEEWLHRVERLASIGTLAAGIAHEINNPLGAMTLSLGIARRALAQKQFHVVEEAIAGLEADIFRCSRIVKSMLQFSRQEASPKWPCNVADVVRRARDLTRRQSLSEGVTVRLHQDGPPPFAAINPTEMEQVLVNLISNAVQASRKGQAVTVTTRTEEGIVRILVEDSGCGMRPEEISRMFDPFFTTKQDEGRTGLGLSMTYGIIKSHGGNIEVTSAPGKGTAITILLTNISMPEPPPDAPPPPTGRQPT